MTSTCSEMYNNHKTEPLCEYLFRHCLFCICGRAWLFWTISLQRQNNCLVSIKDNHGKGWTMNPPQMGMQGNWCRKRVFFFNIFSIHNFAKISVLMSYETPFCTSSFHSYELKKHVVLTRMVMWLHLKENIVIEEWVGFFFKYGNWKWKRLLLLFVFLTHLCIKQSS